MNKKEKVLNVFSAIAFLISCVGSLIVYTPMLINYVSRYKLYLEYEWGNTDEMLLVIIVLSTVALLSLLGVFISLGIAIATFIKKINPKTIICVFFTMNSLQCVALLSLIIMAGMDGGFYDVMDYISYGAVLMMALLWLLSAVLMAVMCIIFVRKPESKLLRLRFVPTIIFLLIGFVVAGLYVIAFTAMWIDGEDVDEMLFMGIGVFIPLGSYFFYTLGILLTGFLLKRKSAVLEEPVTLQSVSKFSGVEVEKNSRNARAEIPEELRKYKELYDEGVITEEEFTQKKKQLMGL